MTFTRYPVEVMILIITSEPKNVLSRSSLVKYSNDMYSISCVSGKCHSICGKYQYIRTKQLNSTVMNLPQ